MTEPRDYPSRPFIGVGAVIWFGDQVLLVRRRQPPRNDEWSIPGGGQQLGETVEAALRREVREETGLEIRSVRLLEVVDFIDRDEQGAVRYHYTLIDFEAEALSDECRAASDVKAVMWVDPAAIAALPIWSRTADLIRASAASRRSAASPDGEAQP